MSLVVKRVSKSFGGFRALDEVSLSLPEDGLSGLIGPNGAGKSTLFAVISGFQSADSGEIAFAGRSLRRLAADERVRLGLGRTFQVPREFGHLTVRENLMVAAPEQKGEALLNLLLQPGSVLAQEQEIAGRADALLAFLNLTKVAERPAMALSGGQKKLLELGRVLMVEPRFVLLDEPFAGVNPVLMGELAERIRELHQRGLGFLIVEHNLQALSALVDHLFVMDRGRIIAEGAPQAVLADPAVREAYMGTVTMETGT